MVHTLEAALVVPATARYLRRYRAGRRELWAATPTPTGAVAGGLAAQPTARSLFRPSGGPPWPAASTSRTWRAR
ncbi:MAG: hypothetical protein WKG07_17430 [Hymenobacter sp.]